MQGAAFFWWTHALNTLETYEGIVANCNFSFIGPLDAFGKPVDGAQVNNEECNKYCDLAFQEMGNINIYDIYVCESLNGSTSLLTYACQNDVCLSSEGELAPITVWHAQSHLYLGKHLMKHLAESGAPLSRFAQNYGSTVNNITLDACVEEHMADYLNIPAVQQAIHAIVWRLSHTLLKV